MEDGGHWRERLGHSLLGKPLPSLGRRMTRLKRLGRGWRHESRGFDGPLYKVTKLLVVKKGRGMGDRHGGMGWCEMICKME